MIWTRAASDVANEIFGTASHYSVLASFVATFLFALVGYRLRGVTRSGALAGFSMAFLLWYCAGFGAFGLLVTLFALTFLATRLGRQRKITLGAAERSDGRKASQVFANVGIAVVFAIGYRLSHKQYFLVACAAALAEAAADTVSSECGQTLSSSARLITSGAEVPVGTNGAISLPGTACGAVAAVGMASASVWTGLVAPNSAWILATAAICGMLVDSLLGALLEGTPEEPGSLGNDAVNLLGTLSAALLALWWVRN